MARGLRQTFVGAAIGWLLVASSAVIAADPGAASAREEAMRQRVDGLLRASWDKAKITPASKSSDAEFARRAHLDLTGRIPRVSEIRQFLADESPDRRVKLIDSLLAKPDHANHIANHWRAVLLPDGANMQFGFGGDQALQSWLRSQVADHVPWDKTVREILTAKGAVGQSPIAIYYSTLQLKPEELAASTSRAFLGVQIQCAQCHDHPFQAWKQKDFWAYAAFFARVKSGPGPVGGFVNQVVDAKEGEVRNPRSGDPQMPFYLGGSQAEEVAEKTRREQLADWITSKDNPYFAKAAVNRMWAMLFGRGLVHPVDDLGEHNLASHPELLDELAKYFIETGYDMRATLRMLATTEAYQLSSGGSPGDAPPPEQFARMALKPLNSEQLYDCLQTATCKKRPFVPTAGQGYVYDQGRFTFLTQFRTPAGTGGEYAGGIPQALTLMNGRLMEDATDQDKSDLIGALEAPFFNDEQRVETLFLASLSRKPTDAEREQFLKHLAAAEPAKRRAAMGDLLWSLLNSAEFALNH